MERVTVTAMRGAERCRFMTSRIASDYMELLYFYVKFLRTGRENMF